MSIVFKGPRSITPRATLALLAFRFGRLPYIPPGIAQCDVLCSPAAGVYGRGSTYGVYGHSEDALGTNYGVYAVAGSTFISALRELF